MATAPVPTAPGKSGTASEPPSWMTEYDSLTDVDQTMVDAYAASQANLANNSFAERFGVAPTSPVAPGTQPSQPATTGPASEGGTGEPPAASTDSTPTVPGNDGDATQTQPASPAGQGTGGEGAPPSDADSDADSDSPTSFKFSVDGQDLELTQEQVVYLLQQNTWLQQQRPETVAAWGAIEAGTHAAVPAEEYQQYQAWKASGAPAQHPPAVPTRPDLSLVDPEVAEYVAELEKRQPSASVDHAPVVNTAAITAQAQQQAAIQFRQQQDLDRVTAAYVERYGLDDAQAQHLLASTRQSNAVALIANQRRVYSPTGQLLSQAPFDQVLSEAFDATLATDPTLRQIRDDYVYNQRLAKDQEITTAVNRKKALAGSLASTPSAAVPSGNNDPATMNSSDTTAAIANAIREAQAAGTFGS